MLVEQSKSWHEEAYVRLGDPVRWEREDGVGEARMRAIACGLDAGRVRKSLLVAGPSQW